MAWVESVSPSFRARHDSDCADDAERVLLRSSRRATRSTELFPRDRRRADGRAAPRRVLALAVQPDAAAAVARHRARARRYVAGWAGAARNCTCSRPRPSTARASNVPGSREMLELAPAALYTRRVIIENNRDLPRLGTPARSARRAPLGVAARGRGAQWFSGQTEHARPAIARRLREGRRPSFPPGVRDAPLLGGTVIDLLARERVSRARPSSSRACIRRGPARRSEGVRRPGVRPHRGRVALAPRADRERGLSLPTDFASEAAVRLEERRLGGKGFHRPAPRGT